MSEQTKKIKHRNKIIHNIQTHDIRTAMKFTKRDKNLCSYTFQQFPYHVWNQEAVVGIKWIQSSANIKHLSRHRCQWATEIQRNKTQTPPFYTNRNTLYSAEKNIKFLSHEWYSQRSISRYLQLNLLSWWTFPSRVLPSLSDIQTGS